jgi:tellurite resistance protein TerC
MPHSAHIFPFNEFWSVYVLFGLGVSIVLWLSLRAFGQKAHEVSIREATVSALSWLGIALLFNICLYGFTLWHLQGNPAVAASLGSTPDALARQTALEFLSGYLLEKSLAVDNLFVFLVIFRFFSIAPQFQQRVLFYGLFGAIGLRAIFIAMGSVVMEIPLVVIAFGLFLMYQGVAVLRGKEPELHPEKNAVLKLLKRFLPISNSMDGQRFFTKVDGKWLCTPLFVTLILVEITDIMFAFDSVPAIFGLTKEPMVVFTSNIFAVIDLRALYFLLAAFISRFHYLSYGLSFVLIFIGVKMSLLDEILHMKLPTEISLMVVLGLIIGSIVLSLVKPPQRGEPPIGS